MAHLTVDPNPTTPWDSYQNGVLDAGRIYESPFTVTAMRMGSEDQPDATAAVSGHFGRAFTAAACGSPNLWSECLTALVRRSVVAWSRLGEVPELRHLIEEMDLDYGSQLLLAAITTDPVGEHDVPLVEQSRLAVHRTTAWFNGHGDLWATLAAALSVAGIVVSATMVLGPDELDIERTVTQLGIEADALLEG